MIEYRQEFVSWVFTMVHTDKTYVNEFEKKALKSIIRQTKSGIVRGKNP